MKYIKKYEDIIDNSNYTANKFKPGDIVKIKPLRSYRNEIKEFLNNNVGEIYDIDKSNTSKINNKGELVHFTEYFYNVKFYNVPEHLIEYTRYMGSNPNEGLKEQGEIFTSNDINTTEATKKEKHEFMLKKSMIKFNL